jgi:hypothetical protein
LVCYSPEDDHFEDYASSSKVYDKFGAYATAFHGGDLARAAADLQRRGFGSASSLQSVRGLRLFTGTGTGWLLPRPFPIDALPDPLCDYVKETAARIQASRAAVALPVLPLIGAAVGNTVRLIVSPGWQEPSIIWCFLLAESGDRKTPIFSYVTEHIEGREAQARLEFENDKAVYLVEKRNYDRLIRQWKEGRLQEQPEEPVPPVERDFFVQDITIQALANVLKRNPRGICVVNDEGSEWFGSFNKYSNSRQGDEGRWLRMFDGSSIKVSRAGEDAIYVSTTHVCLSMAIQPGVFARSLGSAHYENGLAYRPLLAMPVDIPGRWRSSLPDAWISAAMDAALEKLYSVPYRTNDRGQPEPHEIPVSRNAEEAWKVMYESIEGRIAPGIKKAVWRTQVTYLARLALLIEMVGWAGTRQQRLPAEISAESLERAGELVEWFGEEALRVHRALCATDDEKRVHKLITWMLSFPGRNKGFTSGRTRDHLNHLYTERDEVKADFETLRDGGFGEWREIGTKGRPRRRFFLLDGNVS